MIASTGADGKINVLQSGDGLSWWRPYSPSGPNSTSTMGPGLAHDAGVAWMVMWMAQPGKLGYIVGLGNFPPPPATGGINWQSSPDTIDTRPTLAATAPAVAFGNNRWVVMYGTSGGIIPSGPIQVIRSDVNSSTSWSAPVAAIDPNDPSGIHARAAPALAFGRGIFLLVYADLQWNLVARTSTDGLIWSAPVIIETPADVTNLLVPQVFYGTVALHFANDTFFAAAERGIPIPRGITGGYVVFESQDGQSWHAANWLTPVMTDLTVSGGAGIAFGQCKAIVGFVSGQSGANVSTVTGWDRHRFPTPPTPTPDCVSQLGIATFLDFDTPVPIRNMPTAMSGTAVALAFSQ